MMGDRGTEAVTGMAGNSIQRDKLPRPLKAKPLSPSLPDASLERREEWAGRYQSVQGRRGPRVGERLPLGYK